ncbi:hypothetical protein SAMN03159286_1931 [Enterobacter sp. NFIX58]|nr:hypothetical protein SAMN03159286_1931 [Enterobacter sp. NFIX58]
MLSPSLPFIIATKIFLEHLKVCEQVFFITELSHKTSSQIKNTKIKKSINTK